MSDQSVELGCRVDSNYDNYDVRWQFLTSDVRADQVILDIGCGYGKLMAHLAHHGTRVVGIEVDRRLIDHCRDIGLDAHEGCAEKVPFPDDLFDRIVCSVVVPYTDERLAVAEWERVIKPGGSIFATLHGIGYGLRYMLKGKGLKQRIYGSRMLLNTYFYRMTRRRLPGFLGDTLCQGLKRMRSYYKASGLVLEQEVIAGTQWGYPVYICHRLTKPLRTY
jgi:SAM-dependent methyltransferase